jgi:hypothetical protein
LLQCSGTVLDQQRVQRFGGGTRTLCIRHGTDFIVISSGSASRERGGRLQNAFITG